MKRKRNSQRYFLSFLSLILLASSVWGQGIILDNPVRAGELTLFKSIENEHEYLYLLDQAQIATDEEGTPQFSFLRYVQNTAGSGDDLSVEGTGGGILHALISLEVTSDQIREATQELRRVDPQGTVRGPALYKNGRFALVSSFADPNGDFTTQVLGIGSAPILDGQKAAISLQLTKLGAKVLWESFHTPTPDISFSFEMELEGYRLPQKAIIEANFDQIYDHKSFGVGVATPLIGAEIQAAFDEMVRNGAIKVTQVGDDAQMSELIKIAYNKISEMMFEPMNGNGNPSLSDITALANTNQSPLDKANKMLTNNRKAYFRERRLDEKQRRRLEREEEENSDDEEDDDEEDEDDDDEEDEDEDEEDDDDEDDEDEEDGDDDEDDEDEDDEENRNRSSAPDFYAVATFKMKKVRQTGTFKVDLNKYTSDQLVLRFDENIGDMSRLLKGGKHFHQVNLDDPLFKQRQIAAFLDGYNAEDFGKFINFVTVRLQKKHAKGAITDAEVRIDRNNFNKKGNYFSMVYGWKDDADRSKWMQYEYEVLWSFFGGQQVMEETKKTTFSAINLKPPYERRTITLESEPTLLTEMGVRSITVTLYYSIGGEEQQSKKTLNTFRNQYSESMEILLPHEVFDYEYEIQWRIKGNKIISSGRQQSGESILFVDELPAE